jgi:RNA polymerase sigma-70 factor (ECF subfamily)
MARPSDDDVVRRAKDGDPSAWRELYAAHAGRLKVWLTTSPTGDPAADADDVAAASWLTAADKIAGFTGTSSDFAGWLFTIARNLTANARRRTARRSTTPFAADGDDLWGVAPDQTDSVDAAMWARHLLGRLPRREAEVLACVDVGGLSVSATADVLGISEASVRMGRHRGLRRLRALLTASPSPHEQESSAQTVVDARPQHTPPKASATPPRIVRSEHFG